MGEKLELFKMTHEISYELKVILDSDISLAAAYLKRCWNRWKRRDKNVLLQFLTTCAE